MNQRNNQFGNLMRNLLLSLVVLTCSTSQAQVYTSGGASQLYWDWRPDIASNCYEFTYVNYVKVRPTAPLLLGRWVLFIGMIVIMVNHMYLTVMMYPFIMP